MVMKIGSFPDTGNSRNHCRVAPRVGNEDSLASGLQCFSKQLPLTLTGSMPKKGQGEGLNK